MSNSVRIGLTEEQMDDIGAFSDQEEFTFLCFPGAAMARIGDFGLAIYGSGVLPTETGTESSSESDGETESGGETDTGGDTDTGTSPEGTPSGSGETESGGDTESGGETESGGDTESGGETQSGGGSDTGGDTESGGETESGGATPSGTESETEACVSLWTDSFGYTEDPISNGGIWDHYQFAGSDQWAADGSVAAIGAGAHRDVCVADKYLCSVDHYVEASDITHGLENHQSWFVLRNQTADADLSSATCYRVIVHKGNSDPAVYTHRLDSGVPTQIGVTAIFSDNTWGTIRASIGSSPQPASINVVIDSFNVSTRTDTELTTGRYAGFGGGGQDATSTAQSIDAIGIGTS